MKYQNKIEITDSNISSYSFTGVTVINNTYVKWNNHFYKNAPLIQMPLSSGARNLLDDIYVEDVVDLIVKGLYNGELYDSLEFVYIEEIRDCLWEYLNDTKNIDDSLDMDSSSNSISVQELRRERWRKLSEKAHVSYHLTPEIQIVNRMSLESYAGKGGQTKTSKEALDILLKKAEQENCLLMDDLLDVGDLLNLSLQDIDWLSDKLATLHINIVDSDS